MQSTLSRALSVYCGGVLGSNLALLRLLQTCSCAGVDTLAGNEPPQLQQPVFPAQPGTVAPFQHHVFVRTAAETDPNNIAGAGWPAWPPVVER